MCGIAGLWRHQDPALLGRMLQAQVHRGPDGSQVWNGPAGGCALGHVRLAIVDVAGGAQPMGNEDGTLWLVANGEIYNQRDLRGRLSQHTFRTNSDSEVVLHRYEEQGPAAFAELDGMFALALWSARDGLVLARDRLGIKPLYYSQLSDGGLAFASEIKALTELQTPIEALPPGTWMRAGLPPQRYWRQPAPAPAVADPDLAVELVDAGVRQAVEEWLMADVEVGVFLSGGLDSSLIAAHVRRLAGRRVHSFAVGLAGSADLLAARAVADCLDLDHHERVLSTADVTGAIPQVVKALESCDPALVRSAVPTWFVSELASHCVKVALSGEGADELFAGYQYLADYAGDPAALQGELYRIIDGLHNTNLQRLDRMTMAHGLEGRVPFMDHKLVALAAQVAPELKWRDGVGKWVLRRAAEPYLPKAVVWREKEKFAVGTGIAQLLAQYAKATVRGGRLPSPEEELYWRHFEPHYGRRDVLAGMGHSRSLNPRERWVSGLAAGR